MNPRPSAALLCAVLLLFFGLFARADVVVVFNEIMYHPAAPDVAAEEAREWIELRNQMAVDIEMSGWEISGGVNYTFAAGTILPAGAHLVIAANPVVLGFPGALGPWTGKLDNGGENLRLRNRDGRVMDEVDYGTSGDWPSGPDGGGASLAKRGVNFDSEEAASWRTSARLGGTVGAENFPAFQSPTISTLLDANGAWVYRADGADLGTAWRQPLASEAGWSAGNAAFRLGSDPLPSPAVANTALPGGPVTYYFRRTFGFSGPAAFTQLNLRLLIDDGSAVFLNGAEIVRANLAPAASAATPATNPRRGAPIWRDFAVPAALLQPSGNVLAAELHQAGALPAYPAAVLVSGPLAYWRLDESSTAVGAAADLANVAGVPEQGDQNGTLQGLAVGNLANAGPRLADTIGGQPLTGFEAGNAAPAFQGNGDGGNDAATFPDAGVFNFSALKKFSVEAWVKGGGGQESGAAVFCKGTGGGGEQFCVDIAGGNYRFFLWNGGSPNAATVAQSAVAPNNSWQHVAAVFDQAAGIMRLYVNGAQVASATPPSTLISTTHEISIGARKNSGSSAYDLNFSGTVDEVAVFNRALSPAEITQHYNAAFAPSAGGADTTDAVFAAEIIAMETLPTEASPTFLLNEISSTGIEIMNLGTASNSSGLTIVRVTATGAVANAVPAQSVAAGGFQQIALALNSGDRVLLLAPDGTTVLDSFEVKGTPRSRSPDGTGEWLRPVALTPGAANQVVLNTAVVISEIMFDPPHAAYFPPATPRAGKWIELHNKSGAAVPLAGWAFTDGVSFTFPAGASLPPGGYFVVAENPAAVMAVHGLPATHVFGPWSGNLTGRSERVRLRDAVGNRADEVRYAGGGRWPEFSDGRGSSLELRDPDSDNAQPEAWAASDESAKAGWQTFTWSGPNAPSQSGEPTIWRELNLLLVDGPGECLIDDVRVTDTVTSANLMQNGGFDAGASKWRFLGNHRASRVEPEPGAPGNQVLHLIASGAGEYQGNQIETTFVGNQALVANRVYEISLRVRWLAGGGRLNTRLYFNRLPRTHVLDVVANGGTPGAPNSRAVANAGPTYSALAHFPTIPVPGESVTVSVQAADSDGIQALDLKYSAAGGAWQTVPMTTADGAKFSAAVPGFGAATLVQFYVEGRDVPGAVSTFPARGPASRALYVVQDGQTAPALPGFRLIMTNADATFLHTPVNTLSNEFLGATIIVGEREVYYDVGARLKGSFVGRNVGRVGFTVAFGPDQLFRGVLDKVAVDRSQHAAISVGEIIAKQVAVAAGGIPSMYDDLARFIHPLGTYTSNASLRLAGFDEEYLDTQFQNGTDGQMFEFEVIRWNLNTTDGNPESPKLPGNEGGGTGFANLEVQDFGNDKEAYRWTALQLMNRDADHFAGLVALEKLFSQTGATFAGNAALQLDVEEWLRTLAYQSLVGPGDAAYTGSNIHNFRFYLRPNDGRALYLPWDWDSSFQRATNASLLGGGNLAKVVTTSPDLTRRYYAHLFDLIQKSFNTGYMTRWTQHYGTVAGQDFSSTLAYIGARASFVLSQLPTTTNFLTFAGAVAADSTVAITGTARVAIVFIEVNGQLYTPVWSSNTAWRVVVPLAAGSNVLTIRGIDFNGAVVAGATSSLTINNPFDPTGPALRINEWLAENNGAFFDEFGNSDDWFEIHNPTAAAVNLAGWKLTDEPGSPSPFIVPNGWSIPAGGYLLVWADNEPAQNPASPGPGSALHVPFRLANSGDSIQLVAPTGQLSDLVTFGQQSRNDAQGRFPDGAAPVLDLTLPTPGAANVRTLVTPPVFVPGGAEIRFTTTPGRTYTLQRTVDFSAWLNLGSAEVATGTELIIIDPAPGPGRTFYRVLVQ